MQLARIIYRVQNRVTYRFKYTVYNRVRVTCSVEYRVTYRFKYIVA